MGQLCSFCKLSVCVLLASLFGLGTTALGLAQEANRPEFFNYPDAALSGSVSAEITRSIDECRTICKERSGCVGFQHVAAVNQCRLFTSVGSAGDAVGNYSSVRQLVSGYRDPENKPAPPARQYTPTKWIHNGSVMMFRQNPQSTGDVDVMITYDVPRSELRRAGIQPGTTLFEGTLSGERLTGKARLTGRCGMIQYDVQGLFDPMSSVPFFLRGAAPKRGEGCSILQWDTTGSSANLRFDPQ
jgi:hypothetical protein